MKGKVCAEAGHQRAVKYAALGLIGFLSFFIRLFAVLRYESVIHEFDPYFNFRTTEYLSKYGFLEFWNWFDVHSWYPLGRVVGQTLFPGLMTTGYLLWQGFNLLGVPLDLRDVCVFVAPIFSMFCAWATYGLTKEATGDRTAGLISALFIGVAPSYLSRSTAGGFDNEAIAIFTLVFSFYTFLRAMNRGSTSSAVLSVSAYFYMVTAWGGYVFVTNTIAIYTLYLVFMKRFNERHYAVYAIWYALGTLWCLNIPFVKFAAIHSSEHMSSHGIFLITSAWLLRKKVQTHFGSGAVQKLFRGIIFTSFLAFLALFLFLYVTGKTRWSGRSMTLLDPTYAAKHVPIIASVSEHQPTTWSSFHFDLGAMMSLLPGGLWITMNSPSASAWFLPIYGVLAGHFAGVMVRLMLVLAPAAACLGGVAASEILRGSILPFVESIRTVNGKTRTVHSRTFGALGVGVVLFFIYRMIVHGVWSSSLVYSSPSIVSSVHLTDGSRLIRDDFREAFSWLRDNTHPEARVMSWWDYGYQAAHMANKSVIVDNNTWNNTHIATVGLVMSSDEDTGYPVIRQLDVDYVFVVFGGAARYSGDDINKFLWMIRIGSGVYPFMPHENDFYTQYGYRVDEHASKAMKNSLMYKMSFNQFHNNTLTGGRDLVRNSMVMKVDKLKYMTEAYTTSNWMVRIYRVNKPNERLPFGQKPLRNVLVDPPLPIRG